MPDPYVEIHRLPSGRWIGFVVLDPAVSEQADDAFAGPSWNAVADDVRKSYPSAQIQPVCGECLAKGAGTYLVEPGGRNV